MTAAASIVTTINRTTTTMITIRMIPSMTITKINKLFYNNSNTNNNIAITAKNTDTKTRQIWCTTGEISTTTQTQ